MRLLAHALAFTAFVALLSHASAAEKSAISFKKTKLDDKFRSEGVAVGDFNKDGKADIATGSVYYAAPDWKRINILEMPEEFDPAVYSKSFCNYAEDVNGDGWLDLIVVDFPGAQTWWFENPQASGGPWARHEATPVTNNESPTYLDLDGDGKREVILGFQPEPKGIMGYLRPGPDVKAPWVATAISPEGAPGTNRFSHGLGVGDINKDGRNDILVKQGWWEAPATKGQGLWKFHEAPFGEDCAQMYVYDFDGDGDNDVASSSAHRVGLWWHEQTASGWQTHEIDNSISQTHSMCFADINSDGLPDLITGKRWWAHGAKGDVNPDHPAVVCWYELTRKEGKPVWIPHVFDQDSGVGTQFEVADVNADGLLDVVTSNKKGSFYFEQSRK